MPASITLSFSSRARNTDAGTGTALVKSSVLIDTQWVLGHRCCLIGETMSISLTPKFMKLWLSYRHFIWKSKIQLGSFTPVLETFLYSTMKKMKIFAESFSAKHCTTTVSPFYIPISCQGTEQTLILMWSRSLICQHLWTFVTAAL